MADGSYKQFCPVAMATEILCSRWTLLLVRELVCGSTRFNDLRRGVPRMSPALLSKRLKDLEAGGVVTRVQSDENPDIFEYHLEPPRVYRRVSGSMITRLFRRYSRQRRKPPLLRSV